MITRHGRVIQSLEGSLSGAGTFRESSLEKADPAFMARDLVHPTIRRDGTLNQHS